MAQGGKGGDGGSGETGGPCQTDDDCSDQLACTGVEQCDAGTCVPGNPPCENPDPANCEAPCVEPEPSGPVVCGSVRGRDADGDTHRSAACAENPGPDCDDQQELVHPGVEELCDGVDNDCNGKVDLADGLVLSGSSEQLRVVASYSAIAWSPAHEIYGVSFTANPPIGNLFPQNVYYSAIDPENQQTLSPVPLTELTGAGEATGATAIAWHNDYFGVAHAGHAADVWFRRVTFDGLPQPQREVDPDTGAFAQNVALAAMPDGDWAVAWHEAYSTYDAVKARTIDGEDVVSGEFLVAEPALAVRMARSGNGFGLVWETRGELDEPLAIFEPRSQVFAPLQRLTLSSPVGSDPVIAAGPNGFGVAFTDGDDIVFQELTTTGQMSCAPVALPADGFIPGDIVATGLGFLIVSASAKLEAIEVLAGCRFRQRFTIDDSEAERVHIASGGARGFGVVWDSGPTPSGSDVNTRTFGAHFCD